MNKYSLDKVAETAATTRGWIAYVSERDEGSAYDLGAFDPSLVGMLSKFPTGCGGYLIQAFYLGVKEGHCAFIGFGSLAFL